MNQPPLLVRVGVGYFRRLSRQHGKVDVGDGVHFLNPKERAALKRTVRQAVTRAAIAGALSTVVAATTEVLAQPILGHHPSHAPLSATVRFWAVTGSVTVVASILEILYLYWDGLRAVHRLSREAGLDLFPHEADEAALASAMARAALELPNPTGQLFGVNPFREASRLRLVAASFVYKAKVSVSNFAIKALVRRALGRAVVRAWLPFVAVPITAAWNAWVCWVIMREARVRAMGPSAAREMIDRIFDGAPPLPGESPRPTTLGPRALATTMRAVASSIVRTEDMHPNLVAMLEEVVERSGVVSRREPKARIAEIDDAGAVDDPKAFLMQLAMLDEAERGTVLKVLSVAAVIDGRITRAEANLLREARRTCGRSTSLDAVERLRRAFLAGDAIDWDLIETL
ncbi:LBF_2804 family protein [Labilithrix luteola]|uniref:LBF_2804 family protein n=1 Tax=Labilithrix luteola TaxID=1391654 RepID=UPI0011BA8CBC|nr:hypothetical protein [Labilithrix luteola]